MKNNFQTFINGYYGQELLKSNKLSDDGIWEIIGEDSNTSMQGCADAPSLGIVEGKLLDVIHYAINIDRFYSWGGGGRIKSIGPIKKITSTTVSEMNRLREQLINAEKNADRIREELRKYE
jgi:hypothetical protein